jgi:hypothetical protein
MLGVLAQLAAAGLILIMLGAIQRKMFIWHTGFWGSSGGERMELRHDAGRNESGYSYNGWW